jgi:hypothetical protein
LCFSTNAIASALVRTAFTLEIDMIKPPDDPSARRIFRDGAGPAVAAKATPLLTPASAQAEGDRQAGAESGNGNGFYRFQIGDFQATVISDGYGDFPVWRPSSRTSLKPNLPRC